MGRGGWGGGAGLGQEAHYGGYGGYGGDHHGADADGEAGLEGPAWGDCTTEGTEGERGFVIPAEAGIQGVGDGDGFPPGRGNPSAGSGQARGG